MASPTTTTDPTLDTSTSTTITIDSPSLPSLLLSPMTLPLPIPPSNLTKILTQPPFLPFPNALNLRSISHSPHPSLHPGLLYRSGTLQHLSPAAREELNTRYHVSLIIDTRSQGEIPGGEEGSSEETKLWAATGAGVMRLWIPGYGHGDGDTSEESGGDERKRTAGGRTNTLDLSAFAEADGEHGWKKSYAEVAVQYREVVRVLVEFFAASASSCVPDTEIEIGNGVEKGEEVKSKIHRAAIIHCTAGKDRTGVITAIVQLMLSLPRSYILHSYMLSRLGIEPHREFLTEKVRGWLAHRRGHHDHERGEDGNEGGNVEAAVVKNNDDDYMKEALSIPGFENWGVYMRPRYMEVFLDWIEEEYGGVMGYLKFCGLEEETVERARENMRGW